LEHGKNQIPVIGPFATNQAPYQEKVPIQGNILDVVDFRKQDKKLFIIYLA